MVWVVVVERRREERIGEEWKLLLVNLEKAKRVGLDCSLDFEVADGRVHLAPGVTGWSLALLAEAQLRG